MIIDGKKIAQEIREEIKTEISKLSGSPGLTFVLVGNDPASRTYVGMKKKGCAHVGIRSNVIELPESVSQTELLNTIEDLNQDPNVDGILVQLPLPKQIDENKVMLTIDPMKDVDGFHPVNVGKMLLGDESGFLPCTPHGIKVLLEKSKIDPAHKHVVVVGRSNIVGKPLAAIMVQKKPYCNATVTIAHSGTKDLAQITRQADILVAAIGKEHFIKKEMVKPKAVVIDVGINRITKQGKSMLVGDIDFDEVSKVASHITPVPGGVGPMTITILLQNTLKSFLQKGS